MNKINKMNKLIIIGLILSIFQINNAFARLQATLITLSKTVALAATPEAIVATKTFSSDVVIQAKSTNTQSVFVGPCSGSQDFELLAGTTISISEVTHINTETDFDLNRICLKVNVNGEGANILLTKFVSQ